MGGDLNEKFMINCFRHLLRVRHARSAYTPEAWPLEWLAILALDLPVELSLRILKPMTRLKQSTLSQLIIG